MVADLLRQHDFIGHKNDEVFQLLGSPTCYSEYSDMPCYDVEFSEGDRRSLIFGVNHSDRYGTVIDLELRSLPKVKSALVITTVPPLIFSPLPGPLARIRVVAYDLDIARTQKS
jgi:hypothetical protein